MWVPDPKRESPGHSHGRGFLYLIFELLNAVQEPGRLATIEGTSKVPHLTDLLRSSGGILPHHHVKEDGGFTATRHIANLKDFTLHFKKIRLVRGITPSPDLILKFTEDLVGGQRAKLGEITAIPSRLHHGVSRLGTGDKLLLIEV